jgi:hypothetical protein
MRRLSLTLYSFRLSLISNPRPRSRSMTISQTGQNRSEVFLREHTADGCNRAQLLVNDHRLVLSREAGRRRAG